MRVLVIKTTSMGDVIHTLPALTDASQAIPGITFDWVVEENFAEVPSWHPNVKNIIPVAIRRWKKNIFSKQTRAEWKAFKEKLQATHYDFVIDAQGLLKSALLARFAKGIKCGPDFKSARDPRASWFYQRKFFAGHRKNLHAVTRLRNLFSQALKYRIDENSVADYGIDRGRFYDANLATPYLVFLHGTTWATKHWPEEYWTELGKIATANQFHVKLGWGNEAEKARAERIAGNNSAIQVLPRLNLVGMAKILANAKAVVGVDTGLSHLTAALAVPALSLYGPTDAKLTGAMGRNQVQLQTPFPCSPCLSRECTYQGHSPLYPPCFTTLPPVLVWTELLTVLTSAGSSPFKLQGSS